MGDPDPFNRKDSMRAINKAVEREVDDAMKATYGTQGYKRPETPKGAISPRMEFELTGQPIAVGVPTAIQ